MAKTVCETQKILCQQWDHVPLVGIVLKYSKIREL